MKRVLLTGAGAPGGPGIIKALKKAGYVLHIADSNAFASGRFLHEPFIQIPSADNDDFIEVVLQYCIEQKIDVVFPLITKELLHFSKAKAAFALHHIQIIVSDEESLRTANDKGKLYQLLASQQLSVPQFAIVHTIDGLIDAAKDLGYPSVPICIKPTVSNGSRGVRILMHDADEYDLLFHHKPNHLFTNLERICGILENRFFPELLVSEYLPGQEFTVDSIIQEGIPKLILPRSRTKMQSGISVQGTFINNEAIISYCDQVLRSLHLSGPIGLQLKEDVDGKFKLLEINPRIQGTSVAAMGLGINLPDLGIRQAFEPVEIDPTKIAWGTSFVRYYDEAFYR